MRVALTGAGTSARPRFPPALLAEGHDVVAVDFRLVEVEAELRVADVRDAAAVRDAIAGADAVVHAAALHGIHLESWTPHDYWSTNVTGTFNVYEAARSAGVARVVLCSTMAIYGESARPARDGWAVVAEDAPTRPTDVYGLSKLLCEQVAEHYARTAEITTVSLRLGMFVPETFERYGFRLLFGGVDDRDVAHAVALALVHEPRARFEVFNVMSDTPFSGDDAAVLAADAELAIERYWPGTGELARRRGHEVHELVWGWALWPVEKAKRELGYRPRFGFSEFLDAWRAGDTSHYPYAGLPQWGLG